MKKLFTVILIISTLYSCSSGEKEFLKLTSKNDGKMFTVEFMDKLISEFGAPVDTSIKGDYENNGWAYTFFLGPDFDAEKGKELFNMAKAENDSLSKWFYKHMQETGDQQGLQGDQRYSDLNSEYANSIKVFIEDFDKKWLTIYFDKGGREKLKFSELIFAYQKKFPNLNLDQCIDSLKKLPGNFNTPEDFNIRDTVFSFRIDKSVSYKKALGDERQNKGDDVKDFNIWTNSTITKLSNGKIQQSLGTTYGLTDDSKTMLENIVIGEWIYRDNSKEIVAKLNYFKNGTYTYSTTMFGGMNKRGTWRINFDGEIEATNQDGNMKITNTGIRNGSTIYKKN